MIVEAKMDGIEQKEKLITRKNILTGENEDDVEKTYTMKIAMKKIKYDKDENMKEGTNDPWMRISITSFDKNVFAEFADMEMGDEITVTMEPTYPQAAPAGAACDSAACDSEGGDSDDGGNSDETE